MLQPDQIRSFSPSDGKCTTATATSWVEQTLKAQHMIGPEAAETKSIR